ncbi:hypothetical protein, partial [Pseudomonas syringae]|uniref:hypothetical protein n=1 Tax=Pseudomonas syringae TaxID=317 RepID=UPI001F253DA2
DLLNARLLNTSGLTKLPVHVSRVFLGHINSFSGNCANVYAARSIGDRPRDASLWRDLLLRTAFEQQLIFSRCSIWASLMKRRAAR